MQQTRPQTHGNITREQNFPFQEAAWKEQDIPQSTSAALRAGGETCASWYGPWAMPLTTLFDLARGEKKAPLGSGTSRPLNTTCSCTPVLKQTVSEGTNMNYNTSLLIKRGTWAAVKYRAIHHNHNIINMLNVTLMEREVEFSQMTYSISDHKCRAYYYFCLRTWVELFCFKLWVFDWRK